MTMHLYISSKIIQTSSLVLYRQRRYDIHTPMDNQPAIQPFCMHTAISFFYTLLMIYLANLYAYGVVRLFFDMDSHTLYCNQLFPN